MKQALVVIQIIVAVLLIIAIIMQNKSEGIGRTFGTETSSFSTRRGIEKTLYVLTAVFIGLFAILSIANFVL